MHRNTYLLVSMLAVLASLVVGVNIGRQFRPTDTTQFQTSLTPTMSPTQPTEATTSSTKPYRNDVCKVAFDYPGNFTLFESASGSAAFTGPTTNDGILLTCQKDIPRPGVTRENTEDIRIGSVAAKLYHTQSQKDGTPIDSLIFRHPGTKLDFFLAGTGDAFRKLISSVTLLP